MTLIEILIAGLVQGITEFLPVSSSGHLVLVHGIFGFKEPSMLFDIYLHVATLLAVIIFFWHDLVGIVKGRDWKMVLFLALASVPAVLAGFFLGNRIEEFFLSPLRVCAMLIVTGIVLILGHVAVELRKYKGEKPNLWTSMVLGVAQAAALFPGISRSGVTIASGIIVGVKAEEAFRFSFLLSIPVIAGAAAYKILSAGVAGGAGAEVLKYLPGMIAAFLSGILSLYVLRNVVHRHRLHYFGIYCLVAGGAGLFLIK